MSEHKSKCYVSSVLRVTPLLGACFVLDIHEPGVNCSESLNVSPLICHFFNMYERVIKEYELQRSNSIINWTLLM